MAKIIDLTGQRFGRLLVIKLEKIDKRYGAYWLCKCDCGNSSIVLAASLKSGATKSCKCYQYESKRNKFIDLAGQRFGNLIVIKKVEKPHDARDGFSYWLCKCDCGNEKVISRSSLIGGHTISCGCYRNNYRLKNLEGQKFGRLLVIKRAEKNKIGAARWLCGCECGTEKIVSQNALLSKVTVSCGCYQKECARKTNSIEFGDSALNHLYASYRCSAKDRNLAFELTKEKLYEMAKKDCAYCGKSPSSIEKNKCNNGDFVYNGIDRMYNSKGYIEGNMVTCCGECNYAKGKRDIDKFLEWMEKAYNHSIKDKK